jgi:type VI secretion system secreted protein VgrG
LDRTTINEAMMKRPILAMGLPGLLRGRCIWFQISWKVHMAAIGSTQAARALRIDTPLGADVLLLRGFSGQEAVSQLFQFQLELLSEHDDVDFDSIVGKNVTVHLQTVDSERNLNGFISRFAQGAQDGWFTRYHAEMVPWLWFLTQKADCKIFQRMKAPDIIKKIFDDLGFKDYELRLYNSYRTRDYCVQYRETDFNFVTRLMEEEGICYFFEHDQAGAKHTLVLGDEEAAHKPCPGQPKARCAVSPHNVHPDDVIHDWRVEQEYRPSIWSHTDYNFQSPSTNLFSTDQIRGPYEIYEYPGLYSNKGDGEELAKTRLQETLAFKERVSGQSYCRCFTSGATVELTDHYRKDMNQKWMLTAVHHQVSLGDAYASPAGGADERSFYRNSFECIPAKDLPFRPRRATPKPHVQGCQTAVVVGPAGEEIYTDKYGRVKVQFHWDRVGDNNENSSCWIRVSQPWAGLGWGTIAIPRIGQEVVVDFLEGDPDRPLIIGRVYNAERMPPFGLPAGAVISGVKSNSTKGGGGYNEISLDDTKGNELVNIHAQYDQAIRVEHDERTNVGHDRTEAVGNNETIKIGANRQESVAANEFVVVSLTRTHNVGVNDMLNVGGAQEISIGGAQAVSVGLARAVTVGLSQHTQIGKANTTEVGTKYVLNAGDSIVLRTGSSSISMNADGTIVIRGKDISFKGSGNIEGKAHGNVVFKASKITEN